MTTQNPSFITITLLVLIQLPYIHTLAINQTTEPNCTNTTKSNLQTLTRDVISMAIKDIRRSRNFVNEILQLTTVKQHKPTKAIMDCVTGLSDCLSYVNTVLHSTKYLREGSLNCFAKSLNGSAFQVLGFSRTCHLARRDLDDIIVVMLDRKIDDVWTLVNDVVRLIALMKK